MASKGSSHPFGGFYIQRGDPMSDDGFERKLTAIFSADVKGYGRLMGEDEAATIRTLTAYRGVMENLIRKHRGCNYE